MVSQSYFQTNDLTTISIEYLYAGLVLQDDVYNYEGTLLLIARGNTLNDNLIDQLKKFNNSEKNIKVSARLYKKLIEAGAPQRAKQLNLENETGYTEVKNQTKNMLKIAEITSQVPYEQVCDIGKLAMERLEITEPALLFQCINGNNEVDEYLYRHSINVAVLNGLIGKWLGMSTEDINDLVILGLVHDVGKTKIPQDILYSPEKLSDDGFEAMKKHARFSYDILKNNNKFSEELCAAALHHHERMNGSGYPDALSAESIPFYSRITAISDVYDAMTSNRSYKNAQNPFSVLKQLKEEQFWGLDIRLVNLFTENMPRELIGQSVLMSNGIAGIVRHINERNIEFPIVEVNGEIITTDSSLHCVSMIIDD